MKLSKLIFTCFICFQAFSLIAQHNNSELPLAINQSGTAPNPSAILDIQDTNRGILIPRMTTSQRTAISNPAQGLLVFDTSNNSFWYFNGNAWTSIGTGGVFENTAGVVHNSGSIYDDFAFGASTLPPAGSSSSTLFFYDRVQSAFRGGEVFNSSAWEPNNLGQNSLAYGYNCTASGTASVSLGSSSLSTGDAAVTLGESCQASGQSSLASGYFSNAGGSYSIAQGYLSQAANDYSIAIGREASCLADYAIAMGQYAQSSGLNSIAMGEYAQSFGSNAIALGSNAVANNNNTVAIGSGAEAEGTSSVALGSSASAIGNGSTSLGSNSNANGIYSVALGRYADALGSYSVAIGNSTYSLGYSCLAVGMYNNAIVASPQTSVTSTTPLFIVGNGDNSSSRSNAFIIRKDGRVGIGNDSPGSLLTIGSTTNSYLRFGQGVTIHNSGTWELAVNGGIRPFNDNLDDLGTASYRWDDIYATNGTINTSDRRLKQNITNLNYGLDAVMKMQPVKYQWINQKDENYKIGLIAQDVLEIVPEVVKTHDWVPTKETLENEERNMEKVELERLGIYYSDLIPVLIQAIQDQQKIIDEQETKLNEIDQLKREVEALKSLLKKDN